MTTRFWLTLGTAFVLLWTLSFLAGYAVRAHADRQTNERNFAACAQLLQRAVAVRAEARALLEAVQDIVVSGEEFPAQDQTPTPTPAGMTL